MVTKMLPFKSIFEQTVNAWEKSKKSRVASGRSMFLIAQTSKEAALVSVLEN